MGAKKKTGAKSFEPAAIQADGMKTTWLVQRLGPAVRRTGPLARAHRVFGGGMMGITDEQWDALDELFEIDYMGAAEYEFGKFTRALGQLLQDNKSDDPATKVVSFKFEVDRKDIRPNAMHRIKGKQMPPTPKKPVTVYAIGRKGQREGIEFIARSITKEPHSRLLLRDDSFIHRTLDPFNEWDTKIVGWFELNNGFFYFIDEAMWRAVADGFGTGVA